MKCKQAFYSKQLWRTLFKAGSIYYLIGACLLPFATLHVHAQTFTASVSKSTIKIGEPFELKLVYTPSANEKQQITQWPQIKDSIASFDVLQSTPTDTTKGLVKQLIQTFTLTCFDTGSITLPTINAAVTDGNTLHTLPLIIHVVPIDISGLKDYHDIKDIIEVAPPTNWLFIARVAIAVIFGIASIILLFAWLIRRKRRLPTKRTAVSVGDILQEIDQLKPLIIQKQYKQFFTSLVQITKQYADTIMGKHTATNTTDEYMVLIKGKVGNEQTQVQYFQMLRLADAVKFAKFQPADTDCMQSIEDAKTFVQTIHAFTFQPSAHAV